MIKIDVVHMLVRNLEHSGFTEKKSVNYSWVPPRPSGELLVTEPAWVVAGGAFQIRHRESFPGHAMFSWFVSKSRWLLCDFHSCRAPWFNNVSYFIYEPELW